MKLILQITIGILLAGAIVFGAKIAIVNFGIYNANKELQEQAIQQARAIEIQKQKEIQAEINRKALEERRKKLEAKRDKAWKEFYQPSVECLSFKSVECVNEEIRVGKEFDDIFN